MAQQYCTNNKSSCLTAVSVAVTVAVSTAVSSMAVSMAVAMTVTMSVSVAVVSIGLRGSLGISGPLAEPGHGSEGVSGEGVGEGVSTEAAVLVVVDNGGGVGSDAVAVSLGVSGPLAVVQALGGPGDEGGGVASVVGKAHSVSVSVGVGSSSVAVAVVSISLGVSGPLAVATASVAGGAAVGAVGGGPSSRDATGSDLDGAEAMAVVGVGLGGREGGRSQAGGNLGIYQLERF